MKKTKMGRFLVSEGLIDTEAFDLVKSHIKIVWSRNNPLNFSIDFLGISELFDEVNEGDEIPEYVIQIHRLADGIRILHAKRID